MEGGGARLCQDLAVVGADAGQCRALGSYQNRVQNGGMKRNVQKPHAGG